MSNKKVTVVIVCTVFENDLEAMYQSVAGYDPDPVAYVGTELGEQVSEMIRQNVEMDETAP